MIANKTESSNSRVVLNYSSQGLLGSNCHIVTLIKNDYFKVMRNIGIPLDLSLGKSFDLFSYLINSSIIWCIQLHNSFFHSLTKYFSAQSQNWRSFASSRRAMEQKMRHFPSVFDSGKNWDNVRLMDYIREILRPVFLNPWFFVQIWIDILFIWLVITCFNISKEIRYHYNYKNNEIQNNT